MTGGDAEQADRSIHSGLRPSADPTTNHMRGARRRTSQLLVNSLIGETASSSYPAHWAEKDTQRRWRWCQIHLFVRASQAGAW